MVSWCLSNLFPSVHTADDASLFIARIHFFFFTTKLGLSHLRSTILVLVKLFILVKMSSLLALFPEL